MKNNVFLAIAIAGFYVPSLCGQTIVDDIATLQSSIASATEGEVIQLSPSFPSVLPSTVTITINHANSFVVDGNGKTLGVGGNFLHFSMSKTTPSGVFTLKNMELKGLRTDANGVNGGAGGGGVVIGGGSQGTIVFDDVYFNSIQNGALSFSGLNANAVVRIVNATFRNNHRGGHGGAIFHGQGGRLDISDCTFDENYNPAPGYSGGAIACFNHTGQVSIRRTVFLNNSSYNWGGAIGIYSPYGNTSSVSIDSCYFGGNRVTGANGNGDGGAISVFGNAGQVTAFDLRHSTFYDNHAADDAGAVFIQNYDVGAVNTITNCTMADNSGADVNPATYMLLGVPINIATCGGGLQFSLKTPVTLEHNTIVRNYTSSPFDRGGGGLGFHASMSGAPVVTLTNNIIVGNYILDGAEKVNSVYANVGFKVLVNPTITQSGNIGFDNGTALPADVTMSNVFGTEEHIVCDNYFTGKVGNPYETNPAYYRAIPTVSIKPNDGVDVFGLANGQCTSSLTIDGRGFLRDQANADMGAVEIRWAKFDANGGDWTSLPDIVYNGTVYYEKDSSANVQHFYAITAHGNDVSSPTQPTLADKVFQYWALDSINGASWDGSPLTVTSNRSLYAIWNAGLSSFAFENDTICEYDKADLTRLTPAQGVVMTGLTLSYYTDRLCLVPVPDPQSVGEGTYYIRGVDALNQSDTASVKIVENVRVKIELKHERDTCFYPFIDALTLDISDTSKIIIPGTEQWFLGDSVIHPDTYILSSDDHGKMLYYQVDTKCGIVRSNAIEIELCEFTPEINRPVRIPEVTGIETSLTPGVYYVFGHDDFVFTIAALPGYSLDYVTVKTNSPVWNNEGGIKLVWLAENLLEVTLKDVTEPLDVIIEGVSPTANTAIERTPVWANGKQLFIQVEKETVLSVYTITGSLYTQQRLSAGESVLSLPPGVYIVVLDGKVYTKTAIK